MKKQEFKLYQVLSTKGYFKVFEMIGTREQVLKRFASQVLHLVDCVKWHVISEDKNNIKLAAYDNTDCKVEFVVLKGAEIKEEE